MTPDSCDTHSVSCCHPRYPRRPIGPLRRNSKGVPVPTKGHGSLKGKSKGGDTKARKGSNNDGSGTTVTHGKRGKRVIKFLEKLDVNAAAAGDTTDPSDLSSTPRSPQPVADLAIDTASGPIFRNKSSKSDCLPEISSTGSTVTELNLNSSEHQSCSTESVASPSSRL